MSCGEKTYDEILNPFQVNIPLYIWGLTWGFLIFSGADKKGTSAWNIAKV